MPPKKNLTKKSFFILKNFNNRAINSIVIQCKVNNYLLNCGKKYTYKDYEKHCNTSKIK